MTSDLRGWTYWPPKDDGSPGKPEAKQKQLWIERMPEREGGNPNACFCPSCRDPQTFDLPKVRPHKHGTDAVFMLGATGSGKTFCVVRRQLQLARMYPGSIHAVLTKSWPHAMDTILRDWEKMLTITTPWDHPWMASSKPTQGRKNFLIKTGKDGKGIPSMIKFINIDLFEKLLGQEYDTVHAEEFQNIEQPDPVEFVVTRMRSKGMPFKQLIFTGNPTAKMSRSWARDYLNLDQRTDDWPGGEILPIGKSCMCHKCADCRSELTDQGEDPDEAPEYTVNEIGGQCPRCGYKKRDGCPGKQHFQRLIELSIHDNRSNLREGYGADINSMLRDDQAKRLGRGKIVLDAGNICYPSMAQDNVVRDEKNRLGEIVRHRQVDLNPEKDIIWHLDFNNRPQCSGISQETVGDDNITYINTIEEIIEWDVGAKEVAEAFVELLKLKIPDFRHMGTRILIYGDPNGHNENRQKNELCNFHKIESVLLSAGIKHEVVTPHTVYGIHERVSSVNALMRTVIKTGDPNNPTLSELIRWRVNERCKFHILSAERTKWNKQATKECEREDIKARDEGKAGQLWSLTHPMAGFGYYVIERHPEVPNGVVGGSLPCIASTGSNLVTEIDEKGIVRVRRMGSFADEDDDDDEDEIDELIQIAQASDLPFEGQINRAQQRYYDAKLFGGGETIANSLRARGAFNLRMREIKNPHWR